LGAIFNVKSDAVILNPVKRVFLENWTDSGSERCYITYVGRLVKIKNLHRMIPAIQDILNENPGLRMCIIGDGEQAPELRAMVADDPRFEFKGLPDDATVCETLRRSKLFVSGNEVEGFGITYLEAMTQGCIVAMPGSGGGIEIALEKVGRSVQLLPLSWDRAELRTALRRALEQKWEPISTSAYTVDSVVESYLRVDAQFSPSGKRTNVPVMATLQA
jgi:glycosyltransferase involved in cell wall biosynthesis